MDVQEIPEQTVSMALTAPETVAPGSTFTVTHSFSGLGELMDPLYIVQMDLTYPEGLTCESVVPNDRHRREPDGRHPQRRTESDDPLR